MVVGVYVLLHQCLFAQQNYGENLKRVGAQIPGVSRGAPTQRYLTRVLSRITLPGALFLGLVAVLPWLLGLIIPQIGQLNPVALLLIQSAGLLIVVGVVRDAFFNIEAELKLHGYDDALLDPLGWRVACRPISFCLVRRAPERALRPRRFQSNLACRIFPRVISSERI